MHALEVLHNDIKADNILMMMPDGGLTPRPIMIDFGSASSLYGTTYNVAMENRGPHRHLAPEAQAGFSTTTASDIYSLGRWTTGGYDFFLLLSLIYCLNIIITIYCHHGRD